MSRLDAYEQPPAPRREFRPTAKQKEIATRNLAYDVGRANKQPTAEQRRDSIFMASWRRGQEARTNDG